jgi:rRNA maturation protein Nop10
LHVILNQDQATGERIYREKLAAAGIKVISAKPGRFSLEDVFISVVEKARSAGKAGVEE